MKKKFDFSGWATRANLKCSDGRTILKDAFKHNDGIRVPLVWNHQHNDPSNILGYGILEHRDEGVYVRCSFNDTENAYTAKELIMHGDINALSIYANNLKEKMSNVLHGDIREVSLVLAGANPGAFIDYSSISHGEDSDGEAVIYTGESISLYHSEDDVHSTKFEDKNIEHSEKEDSQDDKKDEKKENDEKKTIEEVFDTLTDVQKEAAWALVGAALGKDEKNEEEEEGGKEMKHNLFDSEESKQDGVLTHAMQADIISLAKSHNVGSLQTAIGIYAQENSLAHGIDEIEQLFPDYKDVRPGAPELIERDQTWVGEVMRKTHKSPISRIRTRQADARGADLRAKGYQKKGDEKTLSGNIKLMGRTTDPQTVYRKDALHRDDIIDITDFDVVEYQYGVMKSNLYEDIALATMIGDGRDDGDADKIHEEHIRSIWNDDELYTIHCDVDIEGMRNELQGSNTSANFGENYIYAEAMVQAALYSREQYKGSGNLEFYCTPHLLNVMLLARDLNGRRIYDSKSDLAKALNVSAIHTAEQFEGRIRTTEDNKKKKLLGIFVNLNDYQHGSTKGGEITRFEQFDIDFNQNKYLIETRLSGALTKIKSAIALEEPVTEEAAG